MKKDSTKKTQVSSEEIASEVKQKLTKEHINHLHSVFGSKDNEVALDLFIAKIVDVLEARYTYKIIHEDVSHETRDTYIAMCRVAKQLPFIYAGLKKMILPKASKETKEEEI